MPLLLFCIFIAGITAEDRLVTHYRVKGGSVCQNIPKSPPYTNIQWTFNDAGIFIQPTITPGYKLRVDYHQSNTTLCLHNLTEKDSGLYKFSAFDSGFKASTESYRVIIQEAVPNPVIKISYTDFNISTGFCNVSVNCSILPDWLLAVCDEDGCRTVQRSFRVVNITILADSTSIVCIGNNHVSTANVSESMLGKCYNKSNLHQLQSSQTFSTIIIGSVIALGVCAAFALCFTCVAKRVRSAEHNQHQTPPAQCIQSQPMEAETQHPSRDSTSSSSHPDANYENVDVMQPNQTSSPTSSQKRGPGSQQSRLAETVYDVVQETIQEASPVSAHHNEVEQSNQIDTVYSLLQKPKR